MTTLKSSKTTSMPQTQTHTVSTTPSQLPNLLNQEWLITAGNGTYAMGSVPGCNTRRYHGLLIAATHPPVGRIVALTQIFEKIVFKDNTKLELTTNQFRSEDNKITQVPEGFTLQTTFKKGLSTTWEYTHKNLKLTKTLYLHWKTHTAQIRYEIISTQDATLNLSPMMSLRDFHSLLNHQHAGQWHVNPAKDQVTISRKGQAVTLQSTEGQFHQQPDWWYNVYYQADHERGQECHEDLYVPGYYQIKLEANTAKRIDLTVNLGTEAASPLVYPEQQRFEHLEPIIEKIQSELPKTDRHDIPSALSLAIAADDFVVDRTIQGKAGSTILAGYPWFADWGRDTFIALPGLLLCTGRYEEACATLKTFAGAIKYGLIPNRFDDYDDTNAHYNTVDASLWFINAAVQYYEATKDQASWDDWLCHACKTIINTYIQGTKTPTEDNSASGEIQMAGDGLISAGSVETQLTWMDAACGGKVFTPRHGKAVEINSLWYNALASMHHILKDNDPSTSKHYEKLMKRIKRAFPKLFWDEDQERLYDYVYINDEDQIITDTAFRPNQIFACALPYSPMPKTKQQAIIKAVKKHLLTPFGLRTLSPTDKHYEALYTGHQMARDAAYHQGTVWPWLIGPLAEAILRVGKFSEGAKEEASNVISPLLSDFNRRGLGQLNEIHEAMPPHRPVGCIAQAWSVSEILRVLQMIGQS